MPFEGICEVVPLHHFHLQNLHSDRLALYLEELEGAIRDLCLLCDVVSRGGSRLLQMGRKRMCPLCRREGRTWKM